MNSSIKTTFGSVRKKTVRVSALVLCLVLAVLMIPATSQPVSAKLSDANSQKLEAQIAALNEQMANLQTQITGTKDSIETAIANKKKLDSEMNILIQKVELTNQLIDELSNNIAQKDSEILDREAAYAEKYALFKERLRVTHEVR